MANAVEEEHDYSKENRQAWDTTAEFWETNQTPAGTNGQADDGNDMFTQCLLPIVDELAGWQKDETVLDLGTGSGIIARRFARMGAQVTGLDFSKAMLEKAMRRTKDAFPGRVEYGFIDLMDFDGLTKYMEGRERFDIITISTTLKSLPGLEPVAKALPLMMRPNGRIVIIDLHPVLSKPAGHRAMEIFEDPTTGKQQLSTYIKVPKYLNIPPSKSEAIRGQPEALWTFHRPLCSLLDPFLQNGLVLDAMREPAFSGEPYLKEAQSYHNFQQTPMLIAFRLRHKTAIY